MATDFASLKKQVETATVTVAEAAKITGFPVRTLRAWCKDGYLPSIMLADEYHIERKALGKLERPVRGRPIKTVTLTEASEITGHSKTKLITLCKGGVLAHVVRDGEYFIKSSDLDKS